MVRNEHPLLYIPLLPPNHSLPLHQQSYLTILNFIFSNDLRGLWMANLFLFDTNNILYEKIYEKKTFPHPNPTFCMISRNKNYFYIFQNQQ